MRDNRGATAHLAPALVRVLGTEVNRGPQYAQGRLRPVRRFARLLTATRAPAGRFESSRARHPFSYCVELLKHALGPEALFDPDFSVGRDVLAMLAFVVLALAVACRRFSQAPVFESLRAPSPHRNGIDTDLKVCEENPL